MRANKNSTLILFVFSLLLKTSSFFSQNTETIEAFFLSDKHMLSATENEKLITSLNKIGLNSLLEIQITGFCDDIGSNIYNDQLSVKRANHIKELLVKLSINTDIITKTEGKGEVQLDSTSGNTSNQRAYNRRVSIKLYYAISTPKTVISNDLKVGEKILLENILFEGGRHFLLPTSIAALENLADTLKKFSKYSFIVQGHVCCGAPEEDGMDFDTGLLNLSEARAKTIYDYLIKNGIAANRLTFEGLQNRFPTGKGPKFDRRVELKISKVL